VKHVALRACGAATHTQTHTVLQAPVYAKQLSVVDHPAAHIAAAALCCVALQINHPLDCPICDQGGECDLQDQVRARQMALLGGWAAAAGSSSFCVVQLAAKAFVPVTCVEHGCSV
jgi:hypothetical protein